MVEVKYLGKTMTVAELIEALRDMPEDMPVITQGCDCEGNAYSLSITEDPDSGTYVLIERGPSDTPDLDYEESKAHLEAQMAAQGQPIAR